MKLLTKLNTRYIVYSLVMLGFSGTAIYTILSIVINRQLDERLSGTLARIENQILTEDPPLYFMQPFAEVSEIEHTAEKSNYSDITLVNVQENEPEPYRQLMSVKKIGYRYYRIIVRESKIESGDLLQTLAAVMLAAIIILTLGLILLNRKVARSVWQPFYENINTIERFSVREKTPAVLQKTGITEFEKLNDVLATLTNQILTDFQNQKQFSEDVSHEIQTPLAIITTKLENILNDNELNARQAEAIKEVFSSVHRLSKLNRELILLAKIENNQFPSAEQISLKKVIHQKLNESEEMIRLKNLKVETSFINDTVVSINPVLSDILVSNLISNSINHNYTNGMIRVNQVPGRLEICNSGNASIAYPERLFKRFYKENPSSKSIGLGLAIVKKICDTQNISVDYRFNDSFHCFSLQFSL